MPTECAEADDTLAWSDMALVVVSMRAASTEGLGWTYARSCAELVRTTLAAAVRGRPVPDVPANPWGPGRIGVSGAATAREVVCDDVELFGIEGMFFDGVLDPSGGSVGPDLSAPGHGVTFRAADDEPYRGA